MDLDILRRVELVNCTELLQARRELENVDKLGETVPVPHPEPHRNSNLT